jgi:hypothetical protein
MITLLWLARFGIRLAIQVSHPSADHHGRPLRRRPSIPRDSQFIGGRRQFFQDLLALAAGTKRLILALGRFAEP